MVRVILFFIFISINTLAQIKFMFNTPERLKLCEEVNFSFSVDKNQVTAYRYKLDMPGDWLGGFQYAQKKWSDWYSNDGQSIVYKNFNIEGKYKFVVEYKLTNNTTKTIDKTVTIYWEYPEIRSTGMKINLPPLSTINSNKDLYKILAKEFKLSYEMWWQRWDYYYNLLKLTTNKETLINTIAGSITEEAYGELVEVSTKRVVYNNFNKLLLPKTIYELIKQGAVDLILIYRNLQANEAATMTAISYGAWKYFEKKGM